MMISNLGSKSHKRKETSLKKLPYREKDLKFNMTEMIWKFNKFNKSHKRFLNKRNHSLKNLNLPQTIEKRKIIRKRQKNKSRNKRKKRKKKRKRKSKRSRNKNKNKNQKIRKTKRRNKHLLNPHLKCNKKVYLHSNNFQRMTKVKHWPTLRMTQFL